MAGKIRFEVKEEERWAMLEFKLEEPLAPRDLESLEPPRVDGEKGVILSGRGPIWLYCYLAHHYHPTKFVAAYDPRFGGAVVVYSHTPEVRVGELLKVEL